MPRELPVSRLDLSDCLNLVGLPDGVRVSTEIEIAGTALTSLPPSLADVRLLWRGVPVAARIAFEPQSITIAEILTESNSVLRRVLLERFGLERFLTEANPELLDQDRDSGGERKLLRVPMERDEALVCILVQCPSTGRRYILRVPPTMSTCRQAIAWTAGFDNPNDYQPMVET